MKREFLKGLGIEGLTDEIIDKIMSENGKDISKEQQKAEKSSQELENLKSQLEEKDQLIKDANSQIENFKSLDVEGTKKAADEWKTKFEQTQADLKAKEEEYKNELQQKDYEFKIGDILNQHKFIDDFAKDAFKENLIKQQFKFGEDGTLQGANDYINKFKEDHKGIFVVEEAPKEEPKLPTFTTGNTNSQTPKDNGMQFNFTAIHDRPQK